MLREKAIISPTRRRSRASGKPLSKWDDEVNLRFFDRETVRSDSKDRSRSSSNSKGRVADTNKAVSVQAKQGNLGKNSHPDWIYVPDYYKVDTLKKVVPLSLTASPGLCSLSTSSGTTSLPSSLGSLSSLSTSSARSPSQRALKAKEEIELCHLLMTGNCVRGLLCSYRHELQETGLTKSNGR